MTTECPTEAVLERLAEKRLSEDETQSVVMHIAGCASCQSRLKGPSASAKIAPPTTTNPPAHRILSDDEPTILRPLHADSSTSTPPAEPKPAPDLGAHPAAFGRYRVLRPLGSGGFGTVYLCADTELGRQVAIKVSRRGPDTPPAEVERFMEEARRLARLSHPGIVSVYDVGLHEGSVYVVSAYLEGSDLARWVKASRPTWIESVQIVSALADALAHAHSRMIVHRDIKPSNIIVGAEMHPVLVDFGLALDDGQSGGMEKGMFSGTPSYMSPEQASGTAHRIDGRTDIYGLGVVLYEMLTGVLPFRARQMNELIRQLREDDPQPLRQLVRDLPPELERICLRAMAKQQQDRYSTASDFADELRQIFAAASEMSTARRSLSEVIPASSPATSVRSSPGSTSTPGSSRRRAREAERRQVTLLMGGCDLFESEEFLERLEAEDQSKFLRAFQLVCEQAVSRFEGTMVECNARGLLACFGYPIAYENAARRAARAGFAILQGIATLGQQLRLEHKLDIGVSIGIHTGSAVVESVENSISLVGEARNVARRLPAVAAPGEIICTEATRRLIEHRFECAPLGPQKLPGLAQPIELFRIERASNVGSLFDHAAPEELTPLTGRDHELNLLKDRWAQVRDGACLAFLLIGEPGMGKSRLVHALKEQVEEQFAGPAPAPGNPPSTRRELPALSIIEWRCSPHFTNCSLHPASRFLERQLGFSPEESGAARFAKLLAHLQEYGLARPEIVPLFAAFLSLPLAPGYTPLGLSPGREREEIFRALEQWLGAIATRRPVLFICEDLHWADASTLAFIGGLLGQGASDPILLLLTSRPEFRVPWSASAQQTTLALSPLKLEQVKELMQKKAGHVLSDTVVDQVYARAGGVPLFIEEFTKVVSDGQMTAEDSGAGAFVSHEIPATLQDLLMARVDRVEGCREIAQLAAVLGREFNHDLLAAVARLDQMALDFEMRQLMEAGIIHRRGRPPHCVYTFRHALFEDALYNSLVKSKRQEFHRRIADILEAEYGIVLVETRPELLAHHFGEAGVPEKAIRYWLQAGLHSRERSAEEEAIGYLTRGLGLIKDLPESSDRDTLELELLSPLGTAYIAARGYGAAEVGWVFHRARELCERVGEPANWLAMLLGAWEWHTVRADLRLCQELAEEGMEFATRLNDPGMLMETSFMVGETMLYRGEFAAAYDSFSTAVTHYDDRARTAHWALSTGHDAGITHRSNLAVALWHLGYPDQALQLAREMLVLAREINHPFSLAYALHHAAWLFHYCRSGSEVLSVAQEEMAIAVEHGFPLWQATGTFFEGAGLLLQGDRAKGLALLLKGLAAFRACEAKLTLTCQLSVAGEACIEFQRFRDAHLVLDEGLALAEKNDERCQEAELHRLQGELLLAESGDPEAAEGHFLQALAIARRQQSKAFDLRACTSLARLWRQQGRHAAARDLLTEIYNKYTEGFTTPDLLDARAVLDSLPST